jgi:hypothetical protein
MTERVSTSETPVVTARLLGETSKNTVIFIIADVKT